MKKIPTLFERDMTTRLVIDRVTPGCEWVLSGEGVATRKWDGTCCKIEGGKLFKRYDAKRGKTPPVGFVPAQDPDEVTGHWPGWLPVGDGPEDRWHNQALLGYPMNGWEDGTYELCGPKIGGNPEKLEHHTLIRHGVHYINAPRTFSELREWFKLVDIEGVVWWHTEGRKAKIKARDFGIKRWRECE